MTSQTNDTNSWTCAQTQRRVNPLSVNEWVSKALIHSCEVNQSELCFREEQGQDTKHQFDLVCLQGDMLMCRTLNDCRRASGVGYFWITLSVCERERRWGGSVLICAFERFHKTQIDSICCLNSCSWSYSEWFITSFQRKCLPS